MDAEEKDKLIFAREIAWEQYRARRDAVDAARDALEEAETQEAGAWTRYGRANDVLPVALQRAGGLGG